MCYGCGQGDDQLRLSGRGAIAGCHCSVLWLSGRGAIAGCHCSVQWLGGRVTTNFGGVDVVALHCAMVGGVTANFGGVDVVPLQGAIVVCYGWGRVTTNFGGVDVVPLLGAVVVCHGGGGGGGVTTNFGGVDVVPLITQKLFFAIWGLCWYNFILILNTISLDIDFSRPGITTSVRELRQGAWKVLSSAHILLFCETSLHVLANMLLWYLCLIPQ